MTVTASGWYIRNQGVFYRIVVDADTSEPQPKFAVLETLDSTGESVYHWFGAGSNKRQLRAWLLDNPDDWVQLQNACRIGDTVALISDQGDEGNYKILSIKRERINDISRLPKPVWRLNMELLAIFSGSF